MEWFQAESHELTLDELAEPGALTLAGRRRLGGVRGITIKGAT